MFKRIGVLLFTVLFLSNIVWAQEFGFGSVEEDEESSSSEISSSAAKKAFSVSLGGEISAAIIGYFYDMSKGADNINTREMFMLAGKLNVLAKSTFVEGVINLNVVPGIIPINIDEAYIRAFIGYFDISAGLRKITWGKADQLGPLDIINMPDQSRLFIEMADNTNLNGIKLANPVVQTSFRFGRFSKLEAVVLPSFDIVSTAVTSALSPPNPFMTLLIGSTAEKWMPAQMKDLKELTNNGFVFNPPEKTSMLSYVQAGLRYTTTIGRIDIGAQYFYGRMIQPAVTIDFHNKIINFDFNKFHQLGFDYAQVVGKFNIRAEIAANITEDIKGDKGNIYNPSIGWSVGFDRDIVVGINLNLQANQTIRLLNSKVGIIDPETNSYDLEADSSSITSTRITAIISKKFLRDTLELRSAVVWGIEDKDCVIIPALIWAKDDFRAALSGSIFLGDSKGQLGQYKNNSFLKISVAYVF